MQVGDLVKLKKNGMLGLVVRLSMDHLGDKMYTISWMDGHVGQCWGDLEVISASR